MTGEKKAKKELLIIIPAYNEANNITKLLEKLESPEIAEIADVLIMNDASSDKYELDCKGTQSRNRDTCI